MSVLKKIGLAVLKGTAVGTEVMQLPFVSQLLIGAATAVGGKVGAAITTGVGDFNAFSGIIATGEVMFPSINGVKTGSAKLSAAAPLVQAMVQHWAESGLPGHNKLKVDPAVFAGHCKDLTSAWANILNDFGD